MDESKMDGWDRSRQGSMKDTTNDDGLMMDRRKDGWIEHGDQMMNEGRMMD